MTTYSLTLTVLNRYWVRERLHKLFMKAQSRAVHDKYAEYSNRVRAIQYLLQEARQVPLRASQEKGWLSRLLVAPKNQTWWRNVQRRLRRTRRGVTFSLVAQILAAAIAWLFAVRSSFITSTGDIVVANQLSSSSLWCGWKRKPPVVEGCSFANLSLDPCHLGMGHDRYSGKCGLD